MASASAVECTATVGNADLPAGALYPERDLAAIGDQHLVEHQVEAGSGGLAGIWSATR
jgi:hypothetical protein